MARDSSALLDIVEAINRALNFAHGLDRDQFLMDETRHWAIYSQIVIIGEATTKLSSELRNANPHIPWKTMIGMRHRLVHGYNAISWDVFGRLS